MGHEKRHTPSTLDTTHHAAAPRQTLPAASGRNHNHALPCTVVCTRCTVKLYILCVGVDVLACCVYVCRVYPTRSLPCVFLFVCCLCPVLLRRAALTDGGADDGLADAP